jgi:hypothetical protein
VGSAVAVGAVVPDVPVLVWALTTTSPVTVFVVVLEEVVLLSGSGVAGVADGSVDVFVSVVVVPVVVVVLVDPGGLEVVSSAEATPYPVAIAVPTPNATASPPTRPIWAAAPMPFLREASPPAFSDMRQLNRTNGISTAKGTNVPQTTEVALVLILLGF